MTLERWCRYCERMVNTRRTFDGTLVLCTHGPGTDSFSCEGSGLALEVCSDCKGQPIENHGDYLGTETCPNCGGQSS